MNYLACCALLTILPTCVKVQEIFNTPTAPESRRYKIPNDEEELTNDFKHLLTQLGNNQSEGYKLNVVLSINDCTICNRVLAVLMSVSAQPFLIRNDFTFMKYTNNVHRSEVDFGFAFYKFIAFLISNAGEFNEHFAKLRQTDFWNPRAHHLIFMVQKPNDTELETIFKKCWFYTVLNVAIIIYNHKEAYTYNPYLKRHTEMREEVDWSKLFYDKLRDTNGYLIRTKYIPFSGNNIVQWNREESRYKFYGTDYGLAQAFFKSINATAGLINLTNDILPCYRNFRYRYPIWTERSFRNTDLWMNRMPAEVQFASRSERTYPTSIDNLCILAPKSHLRTPSIFEPYNNVTGTCILISLITFALYFHVLYKRRKILDNAFLRTFGIFLGKNLQPNREHGKVEKFAFLILTMASLLILNAYQGALYGALSTVSYYPEINTLQELYQRTKVIRMYQNIAEYLRNHVPPDVKVLAFENITEHYEYMRIHRDEAYAFPQFVADYTVNWKRLSENGIPLYHVVKEYARAGYNSYILPYGSPYKEKLERVVLLCKEAGLEEFWDNEANLQALLSGIIISYTAKERILKKLSLLTQLTAFYIWGIGLVVSFICFVVENSYHSHKTRSFTRERRQNLRSEDILSLAAL